jgi:hypothetical protein
MSILSEYLKGGKNPANAAMPYLNQIPQVGINSYAPFINEGKTAGNRLSGEYEKLLADPSAFIDALMQKYEPSQGYQFKKDLLSREVGNTAAAGGIAGTPYHQQQEGELVNNLLSEDMQTFLKNVLGLYGTGLQGEGDIYNKGFSASEALASLLGSNLSQQGSLAFQGQSQKNANRSAMINSFAKLLATGAGAAAGGGFGVGGNLTSDMFGGG